MSGDLVPLNSPSPGGSQEIARHADNERVTDVWQEAAGRVGEVIASGEVAYAAGQTWAQLIGKANESSNRLTDRMIGDANKYSDDPVVHQLVARDTMALRQQYLEGQADILNGARGVLASAASRPVVAPPKEKKGFWARLFGG